MKSPIHYVTGFLFYIPALPLPLIEKRGAVIQVYIISIVTFEGSEGNFLKNIKCAIFFLFKNVLMKTK